ncbi:hypothetical protein [Brevibacillus daliensis]|uniref:hypothetical protein n=1 Tax=Brevibacillus daliensis TaxID=2892995 RepID=UPI001E5EF9A2|nr:hypothetical protein [Brevibacillus daliensis]
MRTSKIVIGLISVCMLSLTLFYLFDYNSKESSGPIEKWGEPTTFVSLSEERLFHFISANMVGKEGGVFTNYLDKDASYENDLATGHTILSETVGLTMEYAVLSDNPLLFEQQIHLLTNYFLDGAFIPWVYPDPTKNPVNSTLDDLRIISALLEGSEKFELPAAKELALDIAEGLLTTNEQDGWLYDYADKNGKNLAKTIQVRYAYLPVLKQLAEELPDYQPVYENMKKILNDAPVINGYYAQAYVPKEGGYQKDSETGEIAISTNMSEQLLTAIYAWDAGLFNRELLDKLTNQLHTSGRLYAQIDKRSGKMIQETESPAVYALAVMLFEKTGQKDLMQQVLHRLEEWQVSSDKYESSSSELKKNATKFDGGYIDLNHLDAYSFDQLKALIAMRISKGEAS